MDDKEFLRWIYNRLIEVHNENPLYDYMHKLNSIIEKYPDEIRNHNENPLFDYIHRLNRLIDDDTFYADEPDDLSFLKKLVKNGEPCDHPGCLNHTTHACEVCGRINGIRKKLKESIKDAKDLNKSLANGTWEPERHVQAYNADKQELKSLSDYEMEENI